VGHGQRRVLLAPGVDPGREVTRSQVGPVVVLFAPPRGGETACAELCPPLLGVLPLGLQQGPEGCGVDHDAVVQVHPEAGVHLAGGGLAGAGGAFLGHLLDQADEGAQFLVQGLHLGEPGLGPRLVLAVAGGAGLGEIRQFPGQT